MKFLIATVMVLCISYVHSKVPKVTSWTIPGSFPLLKQCDREWGSTILGSTTTVCASGCAVCSIASGMSARGIKINGVNPTCGNLNTWLKSNGGFRRNLLVWSSVASLGLRYEGQTSTLASIKTAVNANKIVIINVKQGGHCVLGSGHSGDVFTVMDPGYPKTTYAASEIYLNKAAIYR